MSEISKLPWHLDQAEHHGSFHRKTTAPYIRCSNYESVCDLYTMQHGEHNEHLGIAAFDNAKANAQYIVLTANAFPALVEALEEAQKLFELGITHANGGGRPDGMSPFLQAENIHALIEAALKKAEVTDGK